MKKFLAVVLASVMVFAMAACGDSGKTVDLGVANALELMNKVWDSYTEDEKFPCGGGDFSEENMTMGAPGNYGLGDPSMVEYSLGLPAASVEKIDSAASLTHMMNANSFTAGAYHVVKKDDVKGLCDELKTSILAKEWMCGFPEKLVVISIEDYVISVYGLNDFVEPFKNKVTAAFETATVVYEETIG